MKKILIFAFLAFLAYKASTYYFFYTSSKKLASCPTASKAAQAKERVIKTREDLLASTKAWHCLKLKQNFAEAHFMKIHEGWLNPSIEYVNPPFTEADAPEIACQCINDSLQVLVRKLRDFEPESAKMNTLKTQLAYSLSQVKQNNTDAINLHNKVNFIMGSSEGLLAKPKEEIRQHKEGLLKNQSELDSLVFQLKNNLRKQEDLGKELLKTSDEVDALYKIYS